MKSEEESLTLLKKQLEELRKEVVLLKNKETKLYKLEEELRNFEERFNHIIYDFPFPAELYDSKGYSIVVNRAFLEMCRIPTEELLANKYNILKDPFTTEIKIIDEIKGAFSGELIVIPDILIDFEKFRRDFGVQKKGIAFYELTMFPLFDSKGVIQQVIAVWKDMTFYKNSESKLTLLTAALEAAANGIFITDKEGKIIWVNRAFSTLTGYNKSEAINENPRLLKSGIQDKNFYQKMWDTILKGEVWQGEIIDKKKNGSFFTELETITPVKNINGEIENFIAIKHDLTEQKKTENELKRLNRALKTISACNSVLIHSTSEPELISEICKLIINEGGYRFAWIGLLDGNAGSAIVPRACYGYNDGYLDYITPYLNNQEKTMGPSLRATLAKKYLVIKNIAINPEFSDWKEEALKRNYQSIISLPLLYDNFVYGVLSIYSENINAFIDEEIKLLEELAADLAFGLKAISIKSEKDRGEIKLKEGEERYRNFFEEDLAADYISTPGGEILDCNESFVKLFGFNSIDHAKGYDAENFHLSAGSRRYLINLIKKEKKIRGLELDLQTFDNRKISVIENAWGSFDEKGNLIEIKGYFFDTTDRKLTGLALKESELKYRELVENIEEIIYTTDLRGSISYISPSGVQFFGYAMADLIGKRFDQLIHIEDTEALQTKFNAAMQGKTGSYEFKILTKNGDIKWVRSSIRPINIENKITGIQGVLTDITQLKNLIADYKRAKEAAEESEKLKTEFLAQMSHEIRTPVNVILSYSSLLKDDLSGQASDDLNDIFKSINLAGNRLVRTIDLILNMSMFQVGKVMIEPYEVDLHYLLLNLVNEFKNIANEKKLELNFVSKVDTGNLLSDEYILSQVFQNLIENAIKYTHEGKIEIIFYNNVENKLCVDISDTGIGISKEYLSRMFKPFSQEDTGYSRRYEGVGLGLALVKNYLDLLGASINVRSEKGRGSVFTVTFK